MFVIKSLHKRFIQKKKHNNIAKIHNKKGKLFYGCLNTGHGASARKHFDVCVFLNFNKTVE